MIAGDTIHVASLIALEARGLATDELLGGIERIFRATAARWPADPAAARAFQHLWLDQYLEHERNLAIVATQAPGIDAAAPNVVGYAVGCRINPAMSPRFAALSYFQDFADLCATFPAHLHVNIDSHFRNQRVGERLVEALCKKVADDGSSGIHVVTGREQRNVGFYKRLGFRELGHTPRGDTEVLFLGRELR